MIRQELNPETCRLDTETTKLTMHPTNNRRSPEWFPCPRASSKNTSATWFWQNNPNTSAAWFGEILQKIKILSATWFRRKYWGRFWCSWTNRKWPTLIPDCDNSAATGQLVQQFKLGPLHGHKIELRYVCVPAYQSWWGASLGAVSTVLCTPCY